METVDSVAHPTTVEIPPLDERIRLLCDKAAKAKDSEVAAILSELQAALHEHAQLVGEMTKKTLRWKTKNTSSSNSKAAD